MADQSAVDYRCTVCGNSFYDAKAWKEHIRSHVSHLNGPPTLVESSTQRTSHLSPTLIEHSTDVFKQRLKHLAHDSESDDEPPQSPEKRRVGRPHKDDPPNLNQDTQQVKRKRGRPKKVPSLPAHTNELISEPNKRKRGRPKKVPSSPTHNSEPDPGLEHAKRRPGRPSKYSASPTHNSELDPDLEHAKRRPGRPSKYSASPYFDLEPVNRKPGRPKKISSPSTQTNDHDNESEPTRRKRGRPRRILSSPVQNDDNDSISVKRYRGRPPKFSSSSSNQSVFSMFDADGQSFTPTDSIKSFKSNRTPFGGIDNDGISEPGQQQLSSGDDYDDEDDYDDDTTQFGKRPSMFGGIDQYGTSVQQHGSRDPSMFRTNNDSNNSLSDIQSVSFNDNNSVVTWDTNISRLGKGMFDRTNLDGTPDKQYDVPGTSTNRLGNNIDSQTNDDLVDTSRKSKPRFSTLFYDDDSNDNDDDNDDDDDYEYSDTDDDFSTQFSTISQYKLRPIKLGHRQPVIDAPLQPVKSDNTDQPRAPGENNSLFSYSEDMTSIDGGNDPMEQTYNNDKDSVDDETLDTRPWIDKTIESVLAQQPQQPQRDLRNFKIMIVSEQEIQQTHLAQYNRLNLTNSQTQADRQTKKKALMRKQEKIEKAGGLIWQAPLVQNVRMRRSYSSKSRPRTAPRTVAIIKRALIHCFVTVLKNQNQEITEEHKAVMMDICDAFEHNLPPVNGAERTFKSMIACIESYMPAMKDYQHRVSKTKNVLKQAVEYLMDLSMADLDLIGARNEWGSVQAAQAQWDDIVANQTQGGSFLTRHHAQYPVDDDKAKTAAEIDRYVLQHKKYPTWRIIPYQL